MVCQACQQQGIGGGKYCSGCGQPFAAQAYAVPPSKVYRAREGKVIGGVCAGIAARWGWDPILVRLVLVASVLCGLGGTILAYVIAWIVIPKTPLMYTYVPPAGPSGPVQAAA